MLTQLLFHFFFSLRVFERGLCNQAILGEQSWCLVLLGKVDVWNRPN